ncbi:sensor histidine kinase [Amycolatopsis nigrescens]|uniref:sensor histidine kinase n=1 Tax=Amycolatopsis nigrescens TaxID=381445 RepID=UPI0003724E1F|nr:HAMP domain-containing sensor histidine kinase [Amycolatopsis nigrescens]
MRTRLLVVLVAFALAAVTGFALPLLGSTADQRTQQLVIGRNADVDRFVTLAQQAADSEDSAALVAEAQRYAEVYGEGVVVVDAHRVPLVQAGGLSTADSEVRALIESTMRNQPNPPPPTVRPWSAGPAWFARPVGTATRVGGVVVLRASVTSAAADVTRRWAVIGAGALLAGLVFVLLAVLVSRWVLRPLRELEGGVLAVGAGRRAQVPAKAGPKELRALATSVNQMSEAVLEAAEQQRRLIADASHQLRNPLAALRLRVDSLATRVGSEGRRTYDATVAELERLEALLDGLLALAVADSTATRLVVDGRGGEPSDPAAVLAERIDTWRPVADRAGVRLVPTEPHREQVLVGCPESELAQMLDVLLDNAVNYAGAGATIRARWWTEPEDGVAWLEVEDDGPGLTGQELTMATERFWRAQRAGAPRGTGLGLAIVRRQVEARGGSLRLSTADPHGLVVRIGLPLTSGPEAR